MLLLALDWVSLSTVNFELKGDVSWFELPADIYMPALKGLVPKPLLTGELMLLSQGSSCSNYCYMLM